MEAQIEAVPQTIEARTVTMKKGTPDEYTQTIYDVITSDGLKWTAWDRPIAEAAHELIGQTVLMDVKVEQNGKYENRTVKNVLPKGTAPPSNFVPPTFPSMPTTTSNATTATVTFPATTADNVLPEPRDDSEEIRRAVAIKAAANMSTTAHEFWGNVDDLVRYQRDGTKPSTVQTNPQQATGDARPAFPSDGDDIPF